MAVLSHTKCVKKTVATQVDIKEEEKKKRLCFFNKKITSILANEFSTQKL